MNKKFSKRAYGFVVIKSINSNFNADFSGQPRTLPSGQVYSTDKALKYPIRFYLKKEKGKDIFYFKRMKDDMNPCTLSEAYKEAFEKDVKDDSKNKILKNLLSQIDVRLFGATFAPKGKDIEDKNISIHGPVQITHGVNIWPESNIYSEQIMSPFRNPSDKEEKEKSATTLGRQSRLEEGHYIFSFSINPKNLEDLEKIEKDINTLTEEDIDLFKEAMRKAVTYYDSASKAGSENEIFFYVELKEDSSLVLPSFTEMVEMKYSKENNKRYFDLKKVKELLDKHSNNISCCEIYYNEETTSVENLPTNCKKRDL